MNKDFTIAPIFTDLMVLQRDTKIPVWGRAADGCKIKVEICDKTMETEAVNGHWRVDLPPLSSGGPYSMKIQSSTSEFILEDILVGEVWLAGGQSNMEFALSNSLNGKKEADKANFKNIRYYDVPKIAYEEVENTDFPESEWKICNPENAGKLSAVAFHFAKSVFEELKIPIGIVGCNWGGTSASCWMSEEYLRSDEKTRVYLDEYFDCIGSVSEEEYENRIKAYEGQLADYRQGVEQIKITDPDASQTMIQKLAGPYPWPPPMGKKSSRRPAGLYHTMLKKVIPYGIRGVIFYQGEEDTNKAGYYKKLFELMMKNWREDWNNKVLPFLFVQIAYFNDQEPGKNWALLREAQLRTMLCDENTAMAVITDCGEKDNVHPFNKKPVGERLALLARAKVYGQDIECYGPTYRSMRIEDNKIVLTFDHAEGGLVTMNGELKGLKICGEDKNFVNAKADIRNNTLQVYTKEVKHPIAVRYGWANYMDVNLYNKEGLPASPFRTDNFDL